MGIQNIQDASPQTTYRVRNALLEAKPQLLEALRSDVGDKYHDAVKACITGGEDFGIAQGDNETTSRTGAVLQDSFQKQVLDRLDSIKV